MSDTFEDAAKARRGAAKENAANAMGRRVLDRHRLVTDERGEAYEWNGAFWARATEPYLKRLALETAGEDSTAALRSEMVAYLQAATLDRLLAWGRVAESEVACSNGVVEVSDGTLREHQPEDYLDRVIPWPYLPPGDPGAACGRWDQCLLDWFGDDEAGAELIAALQDFAGYVCLSHARYKKALVLPGPTNTGKSQVVGALRLLVGPAFTCQLPVQHMDDPVMRAVIRAKALNVMTELSEDAMIADGGFKTLVSTEEPVLINAKYERPETYVPSAKHVIATNQLPRVTDRTQATYNRLLILPMEREVPEAQRDPVLLERLKEEMPGILRWAIAGARRLVAAEGQWREPARSAAMLKAYQEEGNPVLGFLEACAEADPQATVPLADVTALYNQWNVGGRKASARTLGRMLRQAGHTIRKARYGHHVLATLIGYRMTGLPPPDLENPHELL